MISFNKSVMYWLLLLFQFLFIIHLMDSFSEHYEYLEKHSAATAKHMYFLGCAEHSKDVSLAECKEKAKRKMLQLF